MKFEFGRIFDIKKIICALALVSVFAMPGASYAYDDDDDDCMYFSPAFALCSVHAYNVGLGTNPTDSEQISEMNEVIAYKATVIAQQMKRQYDSLNTMIKRFKTQLEKAVLTSKIEVMTGGASSSSSGGSSAGNNGLTTAEDCDAVINQSDIYDCLTRNMNKISQALEKDTTNARKQLIIDYAIALDYKVCEGESNNKCSDCTPFDKTNSNGYGGSKNDVKSCVTQLSRKIKQAKNKFENENAKNRGGWH